jgi:SNF2 family DNA or RNA helicase
MFKESIAQAKRNALASRTENEKYKNLVVVPTAAQTSTSASTTMTLTPEQQKRKEMLATMNAKTLEAIKSSAVSSSTSLSSVDRNLQQLLNRKKNFKLLIICPSSLRTQWCEEFKRWLPDDYTDKNILCVFKNTDLQTYDESLHDIVVISYALAAKNDAAFKQIGFDFCVADESHQLKNAKSARTEKLTPIMQSIRFRLLLSGKEQRASKP